MKKFSLLFVLLFVMTTSASAFDQTGKVSIGGFAGYSFGFGDVYKKYESSFGGEHYEAQYKNTFCFGGKVKYGITPNVAIMATIDYQGNKYEEEYSFEHITEKHSESGHWVGLLGNAFFSLSPQNETSPYLTAGVGMYIPDEGDTKPGINAGGGVEYFFQPNVALDVGGRFHMIFLEGDDITYIQFYGGINFFFGKT